MEKDFSFNASKHEEQIEETNRQKNIIELLLSKKDSEYFLSKVDSKTNDLGLNITNLN